MIVRSLDSVSDAAQPASWPMTAFGAVDPFLAGQLETTPRGRQLTGPVFCISLVRKLGQPSTPTGALRLLNGCVRPSHSNAYEHVTAGGNLKFGVVVPILPGTLTQA